MDARALENTTQIPADYSPDVFRTTTAGAGSSAPQMTMSGDSSTPGVPEAAFPPGLPTAEQLQEQSYQQTSIDAQGAIDGFGSAWHQNGDPESRVKAWQQHVADNSTDGLHRLIAPRFEEILANYHPTCSLRELYEMELELQQIVPAPDQSPFKSLKLGSFIPSSRAASVAAAPASRRSQPTPTVTQHPGARPTIARAQSMHHPVPQQQMVSSWGSNSTPLPGAPSLSSGPHYPASSHQRYEPQHHAYQPQPHAYQHPAYAYQNPPYAYQHPLHAYQQRAYQPPPYEFQHAAHGYQQPLSSFGQHSFNAQVIGSPPTFLAQQSPGSHRHAPQEARARAHAPHEPVGSFRLGTHQLHQPRSQSASLTGNERAPQELVDEHPLHKQPIAPEYQHKLEGQERFAGQPWPTSHHSRRSPPPASDPRNCDLPRRPSSALRSTRANSPSKSLGGTAAAAQEGSQAGAGPDGSPRPTLMVQPASRTSPPGEEDSGHGDDDVARGEDAVHSDKSNSQHTAKSTEPGAKIRSRGVPARQAGVAGMTRLQYRVQDYLPSARQLFMFRDRIPDNQADELYNFSLRIQSLINAMAEKLDLPADVAFSIVTTGIGFGPNSDWNLFETFHSLDPGVWTERDRDLYAHYESLPAKSAWEHFKKVEGYKNVLLKFACAFPASRPVKTVGKTVGDREVLVDGIDTHLRAVQSHLFAVHNLSLSYIITGADAANDGSGLTRMRSAQLGRGFLRMLQIPDDLFAGAFRSFVQYNAQLCAVSKELRLPLPETQFQFDRIPKLTDPATYAQPHHLGRIWNDNMNAVLQAIHPQLVLESVRPNDCLFNHHLIAMSRLGLKIVGHPAGIPLFWVLGNAPDRGVYALQSAAQGAFLQWLLLRDPKDPTHPHPLGLSIQFAGDTSDGERFTVYQTKEFNWPGHEYHGLVATYNLHTHTVASPSLRELAEYRKGTGELEKLYSIKMKESEQTAKKNSSAVKSAEYVRDGHGEGDGRPVPRRASGKPAESVDIMDNDKAGPPASAADLAAARIAAARASDKAQDHRATPVADSAPVCAAAATAANASSFGAAAAPDDSDNDDGIQPGPSSKAAARKRKSGWMDSYSDGEKAVVSEAADGPNENSSRAQKKARLASPDAHNDLDSNPGPSSGRSPGFHYGEKPDGPDNARWAPPSTAKTVGGENVKFPPLEPFDWRTCGDAKKMPSKDRKGYKTSLTNARKRAITEKQTRAGASPAAAIQSTTVPDSERAPPTSPITAQATQAIKDTASKRARDGEDHFNEPEPKRGRARSRSAPPSKVHGTRSPSRGRPPPRVPTAVSTPAPVPPVTATPAPPTPRWTTQALAAHPTGKVVQPAAAPSRPRSHGSSAAKKPLDPTAASATPRAPSSESQAPSTVSRAPSTRSRAPSGSTRCPKETPALGTALTPSPEIPATTTSLPVSGHASAPSIAVPSVPIPPPSGPTSTISAGPPAAGPPAQAAANELDKFPRWMQGVNGDITHHRKVLSAFQEVRRVLKCAGAIPNTPAFNANMQLLYGVFAQWNTNQELPGELVNIFKWLVPRLEDAPDARMVIPDWLRPLNANTFKHPDVLLALRAVRRSILLGSTYSHAQAQLVYEVYEAWEGSLPRHLAPLFMHVVVEMEKKGPV
ncbi:hypothetical protein AURDEDRAFT_172631 [Auricularia subglabra TFB-10046 SS5]|nr:hypothetical protein AURDEDRAFT_172631 [Auricularia subglabra TFB-10046 SS5]